MKGNHTAVLRIEGGTLSALPAFASLPTAVRSEVAVFFHGRRYNSQQVLITQNQLDRRVGFVLSGSVRVKFSSNRGRNVGFRDLGPGAMFGELAAIDRKPRSAQVTANKETLVAWISHEHFRELLRQYPDIADYVLNHLAELVRRLSSRVVEIGVLIVKNRVRTELLRLAREVDPGANEVALESFPTHEELAARISTTREAVSHELSALAKEHLIARKRGGPLIIKDCARLEQMVRDVGGEVLTS